VDAVDGEAPPAADSSNDGMSGESNSSFAGEQKANPI
jgi:hypothetical protein